MCVHIAHVNRGGSDIVLGIGGTWSHFSLCCLAHGGVLCEVYKLRLPAECRRSCDGRVPIDCTVSKGKENPTLSCLSMALKHGNVATSIPVSKNVEIAR